jgi:DNA-binding MarR family transcriptional regulator
MKLKTMLEMAKKTKSPKKYSILAYIHLNESCTSIQIANGLHFKRSTVRSYLTKLFYEAEIDFNKYMQKKNEKRLWFIEREWCEQQSILKGIFMTQKEYKEFKDSEIFKEYLELIQDKSTHQKEYEELTRK